MRTLSQAWQMYATDYDGVFMPNYHGGGLQGPNREPNFTLGWARGWIDWTIAPDNTNIFLIRSERNAALAPYLERVERNVHKCPADLFLSRAQKTRHWKERVRSVVMNATVGGGNANTGPWDPIYANATNSAQLLYPGPSETSVFLEENADSINDPLAFAPYRTSWIDVFGAMHGNAGTIAFADGHVDLHQWRQSLRNQRIVYNFRSPIVRSGDADISWVSFHSNRRDTRSY